MMMCKTCFTQTLAPHHSPWPLRQGLFNIANFPFFFSISKPVLPSILNISRLDWFGSQETPKLSQHFRKRQKVSKYHSEDKAVACCKLWDYPQKKTGLAHTNPLNTPVRCEPDTDKPLELGENQDPHICQAWLQPSEMGVYFAVRETTITHQEICYIVITVISQEFQPWLTSL